MFNVQLGVDGLLLHDVHDGGAGLRTALRSGVDGDGLLGRTCIFLPVDVDPARRRRRSQSVSPASLSPTLLSDICYSKLRRLRSKGTT